MRGNFSSLHLYPAGLDLRQALAERFGFLPAEVTTGNGSEGILANIVRTFLAEGEEALTSEGTFPSFRALVLGRGAICRMVPLRADYAFDLEAMADAIDSRTKIIYLANPNNPTGTIFTHAEWKRFYSRVPKNVIVLMDEAYFEYAQTNPEYPDSLADRHTNVITLRTFSKAYGLAGARCGYAIGAAQWIEQIHKVKLPFEPSAFANAAGIGALDDAAYLTQSLESNARGRQAISQHCRALGLRVIDSEANFVMLVLDSPEQAAQLTQGLMERGVLVRHLLHFGLPHCVRISVGTGEQNEFLLENLRALYE
jgi:histidinol-phosphate aminotransferase